MTELNPMQKAEQEAICGAGRACSRRQFLKGSAASVAGIVAASGLSSNASAATPWPVTGVLQHNPYIDNLRVVHIVDTTMLYTANYNNFSDANKTGINHVQVKANMDKLACALARKESVTEAWATIFRKPDAKTWAQTKMAMKVNAVGGFSPCASAVARMCEVLNSFGMPYSNMTLFDAGGASGDGAVNKYGPFRTSGLIPPVNIISRGPSIMITVDGKTIECQQVMNDADIFINSAVNKGHDQYGKFSGVTMNLKNHVGTMKYSCHDSLHMLCEGNRHEAVLGMGGPGVPIKTQLCFIDSTFVGKPGDWGGGVNNGDVLHTLVMGTFPGATDYLTTKKIRTRMYNDFNVPLVDQFLTDFGYTDAERIALDTMDPNVDLKGRGLGDANNWVALASRDDVDTKIADHADGVATTANVKTVIKDYRLQN